MIRQGHWERAKTFADSTKAELSQKFNIESLVVGPSSSLGPHVTLYECYAKFPVKGSKAVIEDLQSNGWKIKRRYRVGYPTTRIWIEMVFEMCRENSGYAGKA